MHIHIIGVPGRKERETGPEKLFEEVIAKNIHNMRKENQVQELQSPMQDKPKEEHTKTNNQINKN